MRSVDRIDLLVIAIVGHQHELRWLAERQATHFSVDRDAIKAAKPVPHKHKVVSGAFLVLRYDLIDQRLTIRYLLSVKSHVLKISNQDLSDLCFFIEHNGTKALQLFRQIQLRRKTLDGPYVCGEPKRRAMALLAFHPNRSTHQFSQVLGNCEPQSSSAIFARN